MRNHLFLALFLFISKTTFSQIETLSDGEMCFFPEIAFPGKALKEFHTNGLGGTAKFTYNLGDKNIGFSIQSGVIVFNGKVPDSLNSMPNLLKEKYPTVNTVPFKLGARMTFGPGIYAEPQAGATFVISTDNYGQSTFETGFTYAMNIGYHATPGFDIAVRYESVATSTKISFIGLHIGYAFTFRRQDIY